MSNIKISELPKVTSNRNDDLFLINQLNTTSTLSLSTLVGTLSSNFIKAPPSPVNGQALVYSNDTWTTSATSALGTNLIKAWVNFDGTKNSSGVTETTITNTPRLINASYNVSSVIRNSVGVYTIVFTNPLVDGFYCIGGSAKVNLLNNDGNDNMFPSPFGDTSSTSISSKIAFQYNRGTGAGNGPFYDAKVGMITFIR